MDTPTDPHVKHQNGPLSLRRRWAVLAICASALFLVGLDTTIVTVALPHLGQGLNIADDRLSWAIDAYVVPFASLLITSGALADRFGRRRVFLTGLTVFGLASLACAAAPSAGIFISARVNQGVGASMLTPVALAIVVNVMPDPRERAQAIGVWGSVFGLSMAVGPVAGGTLVTTADWRAVFWVNGPLILLVLILVSTLVPESRARHPRRPDIPGLVLLTLALGTTVAVLIEGPRTGWLSFTVLGGYMTILVTTTLFVRVESRRTEPLIAPDLLRIRGFTGAVVSAVAVFVAFSMTLLLTTRLLQGTAGWHPVDVGLATLPMAGATLVCAPLAGRLVGRSGARLPLAFAGASLLTAGFLLMELLASRTPMVPAVSVDLSVLLLAYLLIGVGVGLSSPSITNTAVNSLPIDRAGVTGGITSTSRQVGTALGAALAGSLPAASLAGWMIIAVCGATVLILSVVAVNDGAGR